MSENPYESPLSDSASTPELGEPDVREQMRIVTLLYWWMGVLGMVGYSLAATVMITMWICGKEADNFEFTMVMVTCIGAVAIFRISIYVAKRLATRPQGALPTARLVGIILAIAWFPVLTVPALLCVRRTTRYFDAYCALMEFSVPDAKAA
jgi:hypothetical protein